MNILLKKSLLIPSHKSILKKTLTKFSNFNFSNKTQIQQNHSPDLFDLQTYPSTISSYIDNDSFNFCETFQPVNIDTYTNIPLISGKFSRVFCIIEDNMEKLVTTISSTGLGFGLSIVGIAFLIRFIFLPINLLSIKYSYINKYLSPDLKDLQVRLKRAQATKNIKLINQESQRMIHFRMKYMKSGNTLLRASATFIQLISFIVWATLVQKFTWNLEDYPGMLTGGFLWFKDLTVSDPYFILPTLNAILMAMNISNNTLISGNPNYVKIRKYIIVLPLLSFSVMTTLQSGIILYTLSISIFQMILNIMISSDKVKRIMNIPDEFYKDTKLDILVSVYNI